MEELPEIATGEIMAGGHARDPDFIGAESAAARPHGHMAWLRPYPGGGAPWLALPCGEGSASVSAVDLGLGCESVLAVRGLWDLRDVGASMPRLNGFGQGVRQRGDRPYGPDPLLRGTE